MSIREEYLERMRLQLEELNATMHQLEGRAHEIDEDTRDKYKAEIRKLRQQSQINISMLEELKVSSEDSWDNMVAAMDKLRDAFVHSFHYFKSQI